MTAVVAFIPDCRDGTPPSAPIDLTVRCDRTVSCNYCQRNALSFDFLCCEDNFGWVSAHSIVPMLITLYFQDIRWTLIAIIWFEPFEQIWFTVTSNSPTPNQDIETLFGSEVGDALIQGGSGLWMGILLLYIFDLPLLVSTSYRVDKLAKEKYGKNPRCGNSVRWKRYKYFLFVGIHIGAIYLTGWHNTSGTLTYGLYVNAGIQALLLFVLYPWVLYTGKEDDLVWSFDDNSKPYPVWKRHLFFYLVGAIILALEMSNGGWHYMANDWFQVWTTQAGILTALTITGIVVAQKRDDPYMIAGFSAAYAIGWAAAFFITSRVILNNAYAWTALAFAMAAILTIILAEIFFTRRRPYNVNYSRRMEESKQRLLSDRFTQIKDL